MLRVALPLFLFLATWIPIPAQGQPQGTPKEGVSKPNSSAQGRKAETRQNLAAKTQPVPAVVEQETTAQRLGTDQQADENIAIQRKLAKFTGLLVLVGFIQAVILAGTVWAVCNQTSINKAMERAWVLVDVRHDSKKWTDGKTHIMQGSGTSGGSTGFFALLSCQNEGKSPAYIYEIIAKFEILDTLPARPELSVDDGDFVEYEPIVLGIGQAQPHTRELKWLAEAKGHTATGKMPVIYGVVRYLDIFNKKRETRFGYRISPNDEFARLTNREFNKQT